MSTYTVDFSEHNQSFHAMLDSRRKDRRDNYLNSIDLTPHDKVTYYSQIGNQTILDPVIDSKHAHVDVEHNRLKETTYTKNEAGKIDDVLLVNPESTTFQPDSELSTSLVEFHGKDNVKNPNNIANLNVVMRDSVTGAKFIPSNNKAVELDQMKQENKLTSYINKLHTSTVLSPTLTDHHKIQTANYDLGSKRDTSSSDIQYVDAYIESIFTCCGLTSTTEGVKTKVHFKDLVKTNTIKTYYDNKDNLYGTNEVTNVDTELYSTIKDETDNFYILKCKSSSLFDKDIKELAESDTPIYIFTTSCLSCLELLSKIESKPSNNTYINNFTTKFNVQLVKFIDYVNYIKDYYIKLIKNVYYKKYNYDRYVKVVSDDNRNQVEIKDSAIKELEVTDGDVSQLSLFSKEVASEKISGLVVYHCKIGNTWIIQNEKSYFKFGISDVVLSVEHDMTDYVEILIYKKDIPNIQSESQTETQSDSQTETSSVTSYYTVIASKKAIFDSSEVVECVYLPATVVTGTEIKGMIFNETLIFDKYNVGNISREVAKGQYIGKVESGGLQTNDKVFNQTITIEIKPHDNTTIEDAIVYYKVNVWQLECQKDGSTDTKNPLLYFNIESEGYNYAGDSKQFGMELKVPHTQNEINKTTGDYKYYAKLNKQSIFQTWDDDKKTSLKFVIDIKHVTYAIEAKLKSKLASNECYVVIQLVGENKYSVTKCYDTDFDLVEVDKTVCQSVQPVSPDLFKLTFQDKNNTPIDKVSSVLSNGYLANIPLNNSNKIQCVVPRTCKQLYALKIGSSQLVTYSVDESVGTNTSFKFKQLPVFELDSTDVDTKIEPQTKDTCEVYTLAVSTETTTAKLGDVTISEIPTTVNQIKVIVGEFNSAKYIMAVCNSSNEVIDAKVSSIEVKDITETPETLTDTISHCVNITEPIRTSNLIYHHISDSDSTDRLYYIQLRDDIQSDVIQLYCKFSGSDVSELYNADFDRIYPIKQAVYVIKGSKFIPKVVVTPMNIVTPNGDTTVIEHRLKDNDTYIANLISFTTTTGVPYYTVKRFGTTSDNTYEIETDSGVAVTSTTTAKEDVVVLKDTTDISSIQGIKQLKDIYRNVAFKYNVVVIPNENNDKNCALSEPFKLSDKLNVLINSKKKFKIIDTDVEQIEVTELPLPTLTGDKEISTPSAKDFIHKSYDLTLKIKNDTSEYYDIKLKNVAVKDDKYKSIAFDIVQTVYETKTKFELSDKYVTLISNDAQVGSALHAYESAECTKLDNEPADVNNYKSVTPTISKDMISFTMTKDEIIGALKESGKYFILPLKFKKIDSTDEYVYFTAQTDSNVKDYLNSDLTFYFSRPDYKCIAIKDNFNFIPKFEEFKYEKSSYQDEDFTEPTIESKYINRHHIEVELSESDFSSSTEFRGSAQYQGYVWDIKLVDFKYPEELSELKIKLNFTDYNTVTVKEVTGLNGQQISYDPENSSVKFGLTSQFEANQQDFTKKGRYINIDDASQYIKQALDKKCIAFKTNIVDVDSFNNSTYSQQLGFYVFTEADVSSINSLQLIIDVNSSDIYGSNFKLDVIQATLVDTDDLPHDITHNIVLVPFYVDELYNDVDVTNDGVIRSVEIPKDDYTSKIEREKLFLSIDTDNDDNKEADFVFTDIQYPTDTDSVINQAIRPIAYVVKGKDDASTQEVLCLTYDNRNENDIADDNETSGYYCDSHISEKQETQIKYSDASTITGTQKTFDTSVNKLECYDFSGLSYKIDTTAASNECKLKLDDNKLVTLTFDKVDSTQATNDKIEVTRIVIALQSDGTIDSRYIFAMNKQTLINCKITCNESTETEVTARESDPETPAEPSEPIEIPKGVNKHFYRAVADEIVSAKTGSPEAAFGVKIQQPDKSFSYWTIQCAAPTKLDITHGQRLTIGGKFDNGIYVIDDSKDLVFKDAVDDSLTEQCRINKITKVNHKRISKARKEEYIELKYEEVDKQSFSINNTTQYLYMSNILAKDSTLKAYTIAKIDTTIPKIDVGLVNVNCNDQTPIENQHTYITSVKNNNNDVTRLATDASKLRNAKEVHSVKASTVTPLNPYVTPLSDIEYPYIATIDDGETPKPPEPSKLTLTPIDLSKESVGYVLGLLEGKTILKHKFTNENEGYFSVYYIYDENKKLEYITIGHLVLSVAEIKQKVGDKTGEVEFAVKNTTFKSERISLNNNVDSFKTITITSDIKPFGVLDVIFKDLIVKNSSMVFEVDSLKLYQQDFKDIAYINNCRVKCDVILTQGMCINNYEPLLKDKCVDVDIVTGVLLKSFRLSTTIVCKRLSFNGDRIVLTEGYFEDYPYIPVNPDVVVLSSGQLEIEPIAKSDNSDIEQLSLMTVKINSGARLFFIPVRFSDVNVDEYKNTFIQPWVSTEQLLGLAQCYTIPKRSFVEYDRFMSMIKPTTFVVDKSNSHLKQNHIESTQIRYDLNPCNIDM